MDPFLDEPQSSDQGFDPMMMVRAFLRRKWLFIIPFILCFSMAVVTIKVMTPVYYSSGQIRIIMENTETDLITDPTRRFGRTRDLDRSALADMDVLLTSPDFLDRMVQDLGLDTALKQRIIQNGNRTVSDEQLLRMSRGQLEAMLRIERDGPHLFLIGIRDPDPNQALRIINHVLNEFLLEYKANQLLARTSTRDFLKDQLTGYRETLLNAENDLSALQAGQASSTLLGNPVNSMNLSHAEINLGQMTDRQSGSDRLELVRLEQDAQGAMDSLPRLNRYSTDPSIMAAVNEMVDLSLAQSTLPVSNRDSRGFGDNLARMRIRLNTLIEAKVAGEYPSMAYMERNKVSQYIYFSLFQGGLNQVIDKLTNWIADFRSFTAMQPEQSARLAELQYNVTHAADLVRNLEQEIIDQNMNLEASQSEIGFQIKVRQKPVLPSYPIEPNKLRLMLMGFLLSLGIGTGLVVLAIMLDRSFTAVDEIERVLDLAVIGTLPVIEDDIFERKRKLRLLRWVTIVLGIIAIAAVGFLVIYPRLS